MAISIQNQGLVSTSKNNESSSLETELHLSPFEGLEPLNMDLSSTFRLDLTNERTDLGDASPNLNAPNNSTDFSLELPPELSSSPMAFDTSERPSESPIDKSESLIDKSVSPIDKKESAHLTLDSDCDLWDWKAATESLTMTEPGAYNLNPFTDTKTAQEGITDLDAQISEDTNISNDNMSLFSNDEDLIYNVADEELTFSIDMDDERTCISMEGAIKILNEKNRDEEHFSAVNYLLHQLQWENGSKQQFAAFNLGSLYENGIYFEKNLLTALKYYQLSLKMGCPTAEGRWNYCSGMIQQIKITELKQKGEIDANTNLETHPELVSLFKYFYLSYKTSQDPITKTHAAFQVTHCLKHGLGVKPNKKNEQLMYEKTGRQSLNMVSAYFFGTSIAKNYEQCIHICESLLNAKFSDYVKARAHFYLGQCYEVGDGIIKPNHEKAMENFREATQFEDPKIQFYANIKLFLMYCNGWIGNNNKVCKNFVEGQKCLNSIINLIEIIPNSELAKQIEASQTQQERNMILIKIITYLLQKYENNANEDTVNSANTNNFMFDEIAAAFTNFPNLIEFHDVIKRDSELDILSSSNSRNEPQGMISIAQESKVECDLVSSKDFERRLNDIGRFRIAHIQARPHQSQQGIIANAETTSAANAATSSAANVRAANTRTTSPGNTLQPTTNNQTFLGFMQSSRQNASMSPSKSSSSFQGLLPKEVSDNSSTHMGLEEPKLNSEQTPNQESHSAILRSKSQENGFLKTKSKSTKRKACDSSYNFDHNEGNNEGIKNSKKLKTQMQ